jgi:dihydropteroate synthase
VSPRPDKPALGETRIHGRSFRWGERTYVMGIVNVTPDSFSGDGLMGSPQRGPGSPVAAAVARARRMVDEGADIIDVGGESTRPGHARVDPAEEMGRVVPVVAAIRGSLPDVPISIDTTRAPVARASAAAGANLLNDVWGVATDDEIVAVAADLHLPIVLMHNRATPRYTNLMAEVIADLEGAIERALAAGVARDDVIVDPGFGFGKTPLHNLEVLREMAMLRVLARPILLGTSRKSTLGRILDLPPDQRLEATLATTALGIASGADMVRVHDVAANVRVARTVDAIIRGTADTRLREPAG